MEIESYPTPIDRAKSLLSELESLAVAHSYGLPPTRYVQVGDIVRDCEAVVVSVGNLVPDPQYDPVECVSPRTATFLIEIIRNCAVAYDSNGMTIPSELQKISERGSLDGQLLYEFAQQVYGWSSKNAWSVVWSLAEGGLQVTSLQITIGIP